MEIMFNVWRAINQREKRRSEITDFSGVKILLIFLIYVTNFKEREREREYKIIKTLP